MKFTVDQVVDKLQHLISRMRTHEDTVDKIIRDVVQVETQLYNRHVCHEQSLSITDFSKQLSTHPRGQLILCLAAENKELEQLRSENYTLYESLNEHQAALDIIMSKYRGQVSKLMRTNQVEDLIRGSMSSLAPHPPSRLDDISEPLQSTQTSAPSVNLTTGLDSASCSASGVVTAQLVNGSDRANNHLVNSSTGREQSSSSAVPARPMNNQLAALAAIAMDISDQGDAYAFELEEELHRLRSENAGLREMLAISSAYANEVGANQSEDGNTRKPTETQQSEDGSTESQKSSESQGSGSLPEPPLHLTKSGSRSWNRQLERQIRAYFDNVDYSKRFKCGGLETTGDEEDDEDDDEEDALTVGENSDELEVDIGRDTHMPSNYASE